jgi:hypothetical protein
MVKTLQ